MDAHESHRSTILALTGTLFGMHLAVAATILWAAHDGEAFSLLSLTVWPWPILIGAIVAAKAIFWSRLIRARARRAQLLRAEWTVGPDTVESAEDAVAAERIAAQ
jgi:hypothetical protein